MSISDISWRGPRPLTPYDILKGRDNDLENLVNKARNFDVLEITASSGVGKSSFIAAGLVPRLGKAGFQILPKDVALTWSSVLKNYDASAAGRIDAEALYRLCLGWPPAAEDLSLEEHFERLKQVGRPVVVLDQFEELIRYRHRLGAALLEFIGRTASDFRVTHIVAARSEYRDRFRPMEDACDGFFHWPLPEIERKDSVGEIITAPVRAAGLSIEPEATELLGAGWLAARDQTAVDLAGSLVGRADVGLLHLQGVLWLFKDWLQTSGEVPSATTTITADHVLSFAEKYGGRSGDQLAPQLYHRALVEYVRECCDGLHSATTDVKQWMDPRGEGEIQWTNGPRLMMAKSAHLFSVLGYKVAQSRSGMFQTVLAEDMEPTKAREVSAAASVSRSNDWLTETAHAHGKGIQPRGLAIDWDGERVLAELLGAATQAWAAASLHGANILRRFAEADEDVYELVHDGMGQALQDWAREELLNPRSILGVITQRAGESLHLPLEPATFGGPSGRDECGDKPVTPAYWDGFASIDEAGIVTAHGLGWDASLITSQISNAVIDGWTLTGALFTRDGGVEISNVVFRNCNFAGAAFRDVHMRKVKFEKCHLHGASLSDCTLEDVEFVQSEAEDADAASMDLFSFVGGQAVGAGVRLRGLRDTMGVHFNGVRGGIWRFEGTGVRHVAMDADPSTGATFAIGPGSYSHMTASPLDLTIQKDPASAITDSELSTVEPQPR